MNESAYPNNQAAAVTQALVWNYDLKSAPTGNKLHLLVEGFTATHGEMPSLARAIQMGIIGWCALPARDKDEEIRRGLLESRRA